MKKILFTTLILLSSCTKDADISMIAYEPRVAVEGCIENGGYASVLLSQSASITGKMDTATLLRYAIRNAKVSISDGEETEILLLRRNNDKLPPYEYIGRRLKGEAGKTYYLTVEWDGKTITAQTRIPQPAPLKNISFKKINPRDTTGYLHITFNNNVTNDFYRIATRIVPEQKNFTPCLYGNLDPAMFARDEDISMQINKGIVIFPETDYTMYFNQSARVQIKFSTQPREGYDFWTSYQNEIINAQNPIFPANASLKSNIHGGIGIWCGYGSVVYQVDLKNITE